LVASVQKLERTLATPACRAFVARLPVCWLCWHYCRMLDQKIARMRKIAGKFDSWGPTIRESRRWRRKSWKCWTSTTACAPTLNAPRAP
jgi:hypothetical protein